MPTFNGSIKAVTRKADGIKGSDDQWYNVPQGATLPGSLYKGATVTFNYEQANTPRGPSRIIDLASISGGAPAGGGYTPSAPATRAAPSGDRDRIIARQSSAKTVTELCVCYMMRDPSAPVITPNEILALADHYTKWVLGETTVPPAPALLNAEPDTADGVDAASIPPFDS